MIGCLVLQNNSANPELEILMRSVLDSYEFTYANDIDGVQNSDNPEKIPPLEPGVFLIGKSPFETSCPIAIPTRGSTVVTWLNGNVTNFQSIKDFVNIPTYSSFVEPGYAPSILLTKLNSKKHGSSEPEKNYSHLVKDRVMDKLEGIFSFTMGYLTMSSRSRLIIATKNKAIYFHVAYSEKYFVLFWTDEEGLYSTLRHNNAFVYSMAPLDNNGLLVIHPVFLVSKWKRWITNTSKRLGGALMAISMLENYLRNNSLKEGVTNENTFGENPN
jgi:hypothetical protein